MQTPLDILITRNIDRKDNLDSPSQILYGGFRSVHEGLYACQW